MAGRQKPHSDGYLDEKRGDAGSSAEWAVLLMSGYGYSTEIKTPLPWATNAPPSPEDETTTSTGTVLLNITERRNPVPSLPRNKPVTSTSRLCQPAALSHIRNWRDGALLAFPTLSFLLSSWPYYSLLLSPQSPLETLTSVGCLVYARDWGYYCNQQASIKIYPRAASESLKSTTIYYPLKFLN